MDIPGITTYGITAILSLENCDQKVLLTLSYENIPGMIFKENKWSLWESGAMNFFNNIRGEGYGLIGLFTYEGSANDYFARCGIVYFADNHFRRKTDNDEVREIIYGEPQTHY